MKNKGFTLIELLAVIVILAIIALIATPIILGIIKDTKKEANKRSVEIYEKALKNAIAQQQLDGSAPITGTFSTENGKDILLNGEPIFTVEYDGPEITVGRIDVYEDGSIYLEDIKSEKETLANSVGIKRYVDGEVVYIDVSTGKSCINYHEDNSKTGYNGLNSIGNQTSCLKFYAFLDDGGKKLNLLLDHNTTPMTAWTTSSIGTNESGPMDVINKLKTDTDGWNVPVISKNYTYNHVTRSYIIKYNTEEYKYKARLITAQEIAQITGADKEDTLNWKDEHSTRWYFFHDYSVVTQTGRGDVCKEDGCKYDWLYDRTATNCTIYGCLNNSDSSTTGYWTSTAQAGYSNNAWGVGSGGGLCNSGVNYTKGYGIRPVITILKSNI